MIQLLSEPIACRSILVLLTSVLCTSQATGAENGGTETQIVPEMIHLRSGDTREWSEFPETADSRELVTRFTASRNNQACTLCIRQEDVKQSWRVSTNQTNIAELTRDENAQWTWLEIPAGVLVDGENTLRIAPQGEATSDDIRVGQVRIIDQPLSEALGGSRLAVRVVDADSGQPLPARITIVDADGVLHPATVTPDPRLAVRTGVFYTSSGEAELHLPPGRYTLSAGRGFEYSIAQAQVDLPDGGSVRQELAIRREVPTSGYVACDPHIHTLTHSGHGDASIAERMVTIAGEGIELAIATDHNVHVDYAPHIPETGVGGYFTAVTGNEVTTPVGHFNIFPVAAGSRVPEHRHETWATAFDEIFATPGVRVAILNHARDLHSGVRPFGPDHFNAAAGISLDEWPYRMNAMEIINSGAVQSDPLRLTHDYLTLLNADLALTPVGSSDSHDVARHFVGQGRTYIRCNDDDPGRIDVDSAVESFLQGRVLVSYGLLAELTVNDSSAPGDLAMTVDDEWTARIRVLGPHWTQVDTVQLYANGELIHEVELPQQRQPHDVGVQWQAEIGLPRRKYDQHLVALAIGPGVRDLYWPTAKPYQPTSADWEPQTLGVSGAIFLDGDGDAAFSSARDYARTAWAAAAGDLQRLVEQLADYDAATASQAAALYHLQAGDLRSPEFQNAMTSGPDVVRSGFQNYFEAWRDTELARRAE